MVDEYTPDYKINEMKTKYLFLRNHMLFTLPTFMDEYLRENSKPYGFYDDNGNDYIEKFDDIDELIVEFLKYLNNNKHNIIKKEDIDLYRAYSVDGDVFERSLSLFKQQLKRYNSNCLFPNA